MTAQMEKEGLTYSKELTNEKRAIRYLNFQRKRGILKPRKVLKSNEFYCKEKYLKGLSAIEDILINGGNITPYMSKDVGKLNRQDLLFNDWGILHLHLGDGLEKSGDFIKRTGPLLFLILADEIAFLINVFDHGNWTNLRLLQITYDNWPFIIEPFIFPEATGVFPALSEREHYIARKSGSFVLTELSKANGSKVVIAPPGLGIATSGDSNQDVRLYDSLVDYLRDEEEDIKLRQKEFEDFILKKSSEIPEEMELELIFFDEESLVIKEVNTNLEFKKIKR